MKRLSHPKIGAGLVAAALVTAGLSSPAIAAAEKDEFAEESSSASAQPSDDAMVSVADEEGDRRDLLPSGGRLLLTGGVSTIEGAGGGGLVPWALIGGYGTRDELGINAYVTGVDTKDFTLASFGAAINVRNRLELSVARQNFNLREVGNVLALGNRYTISQTIIGAKVRLFGDAVLEQDSLVPQVAAGCNTRSTMTKA